MASSEYWRAREIEAKKHYLNEESTKYRQRINEIYVRQQAAIQKEIDAFYGKYASKEGISIVTAKKRAAQMDIDAYAAKAKQYVEEKNFSKKANEEMRLYNMTMKVNRLELLKAQIGLEVVSGGDELEKWAATALQARALDEYRRMSGILGKTVIDNAKMADQIVNASFHNATFSDRIWLHQDLLKHELDAALSTGLIQGRNPRALASEITKIFGAKRSDAERLMRTELTRVQIGALETSLKENGFDWYEYIAGQVGQCDVCAALDGKHFEVRKIVPGENAPPMHPNCRCSIAPWGGGSE